MDDNRDKETPCVGIFWYHPVKKELFGVIKKTVDECPQTRNITCKELCDWRDTPRGRIFYDTDTDQYLICVGSWIKDHEDAIELIVDEFHLNEVDYDFQIKEHWEIGCGWGD